MRIGSLFLLLCVSLAALSATLATPAPLSPNVPSTTTLTARQLEIPVCASVTVNVNIVQSLTDLINAVGGGPVVVAARNAILATLITLGVTQINLGNICLCAIAGVLTEDSVLRLDTALSSSTNAQLLGLIADLGSTLLEIVEPLALDILDNNDPDPVCTYPANSIPTAPEDQECGSTCPYTCAGGFEPCGDFCIPIGDPCISNVPGRKRSVRERSRFACRQPFTACPVSHYLSHESTAAYGGGFECIDTTANLESCGGCLNPFKGNAVGRDCTAIANVDSVACTRGACVVESCVPGFAPSTDLTACQAGSSFSRFGPARIVVQGHSGRA